MLLKELVFFFFGLLSLICEISFRSKINFAKTLNLCSKGLLSNAETFIKHQNWADSAFVPVRYDC